MQFKSARRSIASNFTVDRPAIELAALFTIVLGLAIYFSLPLRDVASAVSPPDAFGGGTTGETTAAATWAIAEVALAGVLLGMLYLAQRVSEWVRELVKKNIYIFVLLYLGIPAGMTNAPILAFLITFLMVGGLYSTYKITDQLGFYWILNNVIGMGMAVGVGVFLGMLFGPIGLAVAVVILTVYDHWFANEKDWMFNIGALIVKFRLPVVFVRPSMWRFQWDDMVDAFSNAKGDEELESEDMTWGIGTADMMIPAGIIAGVVTTTGGIVDAFGLGVVLILVAGVIIACFRLRNEMESRGSGAGLPALSAGVLIPYVVLAVAAALV